VTGQCSTCRWWGDEDTIDRYDTRCLDGAEVPEMRRCLSPWIRFPYSRPPGWVEPENDESWMYQNYPPEGGAIVVDGSAYMAALETTATFGCARWEEVEA